MAQIILAEGSAPSTPAANTSTLYVKADGLFYAKDDAGTETALSAAAASSKIQPITASVSANALTITLNPTTLDFRSATLGSGSVSSVSSASTISVVVSSGSTLGTINAIANRLLVIAINNAGTMELAVVNISGGNQLDETNLITTVAEGGAGAADSANVIYSTTARSNVAYRVVGFIESTQATAGTWATAPSTIQGIGGQALASLSSLGFGQTEQTVTRTSGVTYYNTTGKPIWLNRVISGASTIPIITSSISINGGTAFFFISTPAAGNSGTGQGCVMIRPYSSYVITDTNATSVITTIIG